jgi:aspartyl-tRNA(Asn)/glutamyl-tRNA(Gln) amidotransferase subunit C
MLTSEEVQHVATLARIDLTQEEITAFQEDLSKVLIFFKELEALDTEREADMGHITGRVNEARTDLVKEATEETKETIRRNFPEAEEGYLKVRSVL